MRPVTRGIPAHYDSNTVLVNGAVTNIDVWHDQMIAAYNKIGAVDKSMTEVPSHFERPDYSNTTLGELQAEEPALTLAFTTAKDDNDEAEINETGAELIANLEAQIALLSGSIDNADQQVIQKTYVNSRADLISNIGQYCSYCEMPLAASLAVEHMLPKKDFPSLAVQWDNFLLACPICNSKKNKNPSLFFSTIRAQGITHTDNPSKQEIINAGYSSMLWPSDPVGYENFSAHYQLQMRKVNYDISGFAVNIEILDSGTIGFMVYKHEIVFDSDTGDQVIARFYDEQFIIPGDPVADVAYLKSITVPVSDFSTMPVDMVQLLKTQCQVDITNKFSMFSLQPGNIFGDDPAMPQWTLSETRMYLFNTNGDKLVIQNLDQSTNRTNIRSRSVQGYLQAGIFPPEVAALWGLKPFEWAFTAEPDPQWPRTKFNITITRYAVFFLYLPTQFKIYIVSRSAVELQIKEVQKNNYPLEQAAFSTIFNAGLNDHNSEDIKNSDRRVIKRTRAWFTALQSIYDCKSAMRLDQAAYPTVMADMLEAVRLTMIGTGFWTVWYSLIVQCLTFVSPLEGQMTAILKDTANFPGTR